VDFTGRISVTDGRKNVSERLNWVEPEIRELDVRETFNLPRTGADVGGNPYPDCQRS
jgi:hypothetical protein